MIPKWPINKHTTNPYVRMLYPGVNVKRWLLLLMVGISVISLGVAYMLREFYEVGTFPGWVGTVTLQFLPRWVRGLLFLSIGVLAVVVGFTKIIHTVFSATTPEGRSDGILDSIYKASRRRSGPKIVAVGGGTGMSTLLRGLKLHTGNLTAVLTVADDGGSSGRLRRELGVLPPGDFRQCIAALADAEPLMSKLLQYRFQEGPGLEGHSFGNLFIVAMSGVVGNFEDALRESGRVLAVRGQVLPSTLDNVTLSAILEDDVTMRGESNIPTTGKRIREVYLEPPDVKAYPEAVRALEEADIIVLGPGSLFTSLMPNLLVPGVADAIRRSKALKVYVCNVATQVGETDGYTIADHVNTIFQHTSPGLFHYVIANANRTQRIPTGAPIQAVQEQGNLASGVRMIRHDVVDNANPLHHDPEKLSQAILRLYFQRSVASPPESASGPDDAPPLGPRNSRGSREPALAAAPISPPGQNGVH